jgi:hypothetical protein
VTGQQSFVARAVLGVVAASVSVIAVRSDRLRQISNAQFDRLAALTFVATRLGLYLLVFFAARIAPRGDIPSYYVPEASSVLHGLLPYRDFRSSYSPLHPYLDAIPVAIWHSPLAIILFAILVESLILPLWLRMGRGFLREFEIRTAAILYIASAVSLQFVTIDGQDTVFIAVFLALALLLLSRESDISSGGSVGLAVAAIKFLPLIYAPVFFLAVHRRWRWVAGFLLPVIVVYGVAIRMHLPILMPLQVEGNMRSAGNLPFLIEAVIGYSLPSRLWDGLLVIVLAGIFLLVARTSRGADASVRLRVLSFAIAAITLALLLLSKKSWPPYLMLALFPIALAIDWENIWQVIVIAVLNLLAVLEHSYWATFLRQLSSLELHQGLLTLESTYFVLLGLQAVLLACYAYLLWLSVVRMREAAADVSGLPTRGLVSQKLR